MSSDALKPTSKPSKTQITVRIEKDIFDSFSRSIKDVRLRRDAYLNNQLDVEAQEYLAELPANSERAARFLRFQRETLKTVKVTIALDREVADTVSTICREKKINRDAFVEQFFDRARHPLNLARCFIENPRYDVEEEWIYDDLTITDEFLADEIEFATESIAGVSRDDILDAIGAIAGTEQRDRAVNLLQEMEADNLASTQLYRWMNYSDVRAWLVENRDLKVPTLNDLLDLPGANTKQPENHHESNDQEDNQ